INSSIKSIATLPYASTSYSAALKLYGDSLYVLAANSSSIGIVAQPDILGVGCKFSGSALSLPLPYKVGNACATNMPDAVYAYSLQHNAAIMDTAACGPVLLQPRLFDHEMRYRWHTNASDS